MIINSNKSTAVFGICQWFTPSYSKICTTFKSKKKWVHTFATNCTSNVCIWI